MIAINTSSLQDLVAQSLSAFGPRPAIVAGDGTLTYEQLSQRARTIATKLDHEVRTRGVPRLIGVYGGQTSDSYAAIVAAIIAGAGYVPLNPDFPPERNAFMIADSGLRVLYVSEDQAASFALIAPLLQPGITLIGAGPALPAMPPSAFPKAGPDQVCYILYTSGSTGRPKGVMISHGNVNHYIRQFMARHPFSPDDRFSQTFDLTFDVSNIGIYFSLLSGGALYPMSRKERFSPARFIRTNEITVWGSVPALVIFMQKLNMLKPGILPSLRLSIFAGEAFTAKCAEAWQRAAPNTLVENQYGPTEATITCSWFAWEGSARKMEYRNGGVPIGSPIPGNWFAVADPEGRFLSPGSEGELWVAGAQVSPGYTDPQKTRAAFVERENPDTGMPVRWYKTGDRAVLNLSINAYEYLGRTDSQIKIQGRRIELGEVEHVIRDAYGNDAVVVIPFPIEDGAPQGLVAYLEEYEGRPGSEVLAAACRRRMPEYMCPAEFNVISQIPLNSNGKYDRRELARRREQDEQANRQG